MIRTSALSLTIAALFTSAASPALAQGGAAAPAPTPPGGAPQPSTNAMANLIRLLVQQGTITRDNGEALMRQAETEAGQARAASGDLSPAPAGAVRVPYVPQTVRNQIRDELKAEVMKEARTSGWASPDQAAPGWTKALHPQADVRVRGEYSSFNKDNVELNNPPGTVDNADGIVDYAAINNTAGGFDFFKNFNNIPIVNTTQDRTRGRIRARVGATYDLSTNAMVDILLATGDDNSPISTNQVLGGGFSKKNVWLDRAYIRLSSYRWSGGRANAELELGRFPIPFRSTELVFDRDLNFDGAMLALTPNFGQGKSLTLRGGAFPLDLGAFDFPSTKFAKQPNRTKWMFAGQLEGSATFDNKIRVTGAAAYYRFQNVQGQLSDPCLFNGQTQPIGSNDPTECSTDWSRAFFPRKGNTLFFIRNIVVPAPDTLPASNRQFLGLTYKYALLDLNAEVSVPVRGIEAWLQGNYVRNLAYDKADECRYGVGQNGIPVTNVTGVKIDNVVYTNPCDPVHPAKVDTGNQGFLVRLSAGKRRPRKWGEWNVWGEYRYLESDAVLDSFTDSDFHLGGTNAKGYTIGGTIGLFDGIYLTGRWMSANEISGRPLGIDVFQLDLSGEF